MNLYKPVHHERTVNRLFDQILVDLAYNAPVVDTGHWQAKKDVPQTITRELLNVRIELPIAATSGSWAAYMEPHVEWANEHFAERVGGRPLNPPPSHVKWPYNQRGNTDFIEGDTFSHSYPERLWPRFAPVKSGPHISGYGEDPPEGGWEPRYGIRYQFGDLNNAVDLLVQEPFTRQCYVPLWFPEDLHAAAVEHERVPCTLGYHFIMRERKLHCFYPMRSLDLLRYFRDDAYMAGRLTQWMITQCRWKCNPNSEWYDVNPGILTMDTVSLHCFEGDVAGIKHNLSKTSRKQPIT